METATLKKGSDMNEENASTPVSSQDTSTKPTLSYSFKYTLKHEIKATWKQGDMKLRRHEIKADFLFLDYY